MYQSAKRNTERYRDGFHFLTRNSSSRRRRTIRSRAPGPDYNVQQQHQWLLLLHNCRCGYRGHRSAAAAAAASPTADDTEQEGIMVMKVNKFCLLLYECCVVSVCRAVGILGRVAKTKCDTCDPALLELRVTWRDFVSWQATVQVANLIHVELHCDGGRFS